MRWAALIGGAFRGELQGCEQAGKAGAEDDDARAARLHGPSQPGSRGKQETPVVRCWRGTPEAQGMIGGGMPPSLRCPQPSGSPGNRTDQGSRRGLRAAIRACSSASCRSPS